MFNAPDVVTKNLAISSCGEKRRIRLSTNFLKLVGFVPGDQVSVVEHNKKHSGFSVIPNVDGKHRVYSRKYKRKSRNNPLEAIMEFSGQSLIDRSFPSYVQRFHVELRKGNVSFTPMANQVHAIHSKLKKSTALSAFVGLTGGVDIHCLESLGWKAEVVLEHRPTEARDRARSRDLSEVHALNVLANSSPRILLNEDVYHLRLDRLENLLSEAAPISLCHYSLGCDDHSPCKSTLAKEKSFADLSTMYDMVYPILKQIEVVSPAVVVIENVTQFKESGAGKMLRTSLRRMGYNITEMVLNAVDYGALQGRKRYYLVASIYPGFVEPKKATLNKKPLRDLILSHIDKCSDVTDLKSIAARSIKNRNMPLYVTVDSLYSPTFLKSQDRGISDAVYIKHNDRVYKPSRQLMQELMSIPGDFKVAWMAKEQAVETLGQSIDYKLHHAVMKSVTEHIKLNLGNRTIIKHGLSANT